MNNDTKAHENPQQQQQGGAQDLTKKYGAIGISAVSASAMFGDRAKRRNEPRQQGQSFDTMD